MQTEGLLGGPNPTGMGLRDGGPQSRVGVADLHLTAGARPTMEAPTTRARPSTTAAGPA